MQPDLSPAQSPTPPPAPQTVIQPGEQPAQSAQPAPQAAAASQEASPAAQPTDDGSIHWQADEFIAHQKNAGWYGLLLVVGLALAGLVYLATRDITSTAVIAVAVFILGFLASRQPRNLPYRLDSTGVHINEKTYPYDSFRCFTATDEGHVGSINFIPLKRFMPPLTVYFEHKDGERVIDMISDYLPLEEDRSDWIDQLMRRIRF